MEFNQNVPIYLQIIDLFKRKIVMNEYKPGQKIESVRELALKLEVNPNTVQTALSELERMGIVKSERTIGRFISMDETLFKQMRAEIIEEKINTFLNELSEMGLSIDEVIHELEGRK